LQNLGLYVSWLPFDNSVAESAYKSGFMMLAV
jgi:hypothetical protein